MKLLRVLFFAADASLRDRFCYLYHSYLKFKQSYSGKFFRVLASILLVSFLFSCGSGCVEPDEFDQESVVVEAKPTRDGIYGNYDSDNGGQRADWHETGLKSNGDDFIVKITGAWQPWESDIDGQNNFTKCDFCAKIDSTVSGVDSATTNCICYDGTNPAPEIGDNGLPRTHYLSTNTEIDCEDGSPNCVAIDCSQPSQQNDPNLCTCTKSLQYPGISGKIISADDYGIFHFPLNYYEKDGLTVKTADDQVACKYHSGMGLFIGLFGPPDADGNTIARAYHMFSQRKGCDIKLNSQGKCIADGSNSVFSDNSNRVGSVTEDQSYIIFTSRNQKIFVRDDEDGNFKIDGNSGNDVFHGPNEDVKLIISDDYYDDNSGQYVVKFYRGIGTDRDNGLIEFLVRMVEDIVLGESDSNGVRDGGIVRSMYNAIVRDSGFARIVQMLLIFYVLFFGGFFLLGTISPDPSGGFPARKEILTRILKIALVVFFISPTSWNAYNTYVVTFFKGGMDSMVSLIMNGFDSYNEDNLTSITNLARVGRESDASQATRFTFIDLMLKKMFSSGTAKKVFGLFFGQPFFGFFYIFIIYALIFFFLYLMLVAAFIYLNNLVKIVFCLAIGPIFICLSLFEKTKQMFTNWFAYLGARSLEIILIFSILYCFLQMIDRSFTEMLYYRTCVKGYNIGLFSINILKSELSRPFYDWIFYFISIIGLNMIVFLMIMQIPDITNHLIKISGVSAKPDSGTSSLSNSIKGAFGAVNSIISNTKENVGRVLKGATYVLDKTGISDLIPIRSPRGILRDRRINEEINKFTAEAQKKNLSGKKADEYIRDNVKKEFAKLTKDSGSKESLYGINKKAIERRLDKVLIADKLKKFAIDAAKDLKKANPDKILLGKEMRDAIRNKTRDLAKANILDRGDKVDKYIRKMEGRIASYAELKTTKAAKKFANNPEAKERYMNHLYDLKLERLQKRKDAYNKGIVKFVKRRIGEGYETLTRDVATNPKIAAGNFLRKVSNQEKKNEKGGYNPVKRGFEFIKPNVIAKRFGGWNKMAKEEMKRIEVERSSRSGQDVANLSGGRTAAEERRVIENSGLTRSNQDVENLSGNKSVQPADLQQKSPINNRESGVDQIREQQAVTSGSKVDKFVDGEKVSSLANDLKVTVQRFDAVAAKVGAGEIVLPNRKAEFEEIHKKVAQVNEALSVIDGGDKGVSKILGIVAREPASVDVVSDRKSDVGGKSDLRDSTIAKVSNEEKVSSLSNDLKETVQRFDGVVAKVQSGEIVVQDRKSEIEEIYSRVLQLNELLNIVDGKTVVEVDVGVGVKNLVKSKEMVKGKNQNSAKSSVSEELTSDEVDNVDKKVERQSVARDSEIARDYRDRGDLSLGEELKVVVQRFDVVVAKVQSGGFIVNERREEIEKIYKKLEELNEALIVVGGTKKMVNNLGLVSGKKHDTSSKKFAVDKVANEEKVLSFDEFKVEVQRLKHNTDRIQSGISVVRGRGEELEKFYKKVDELNELLNIVDGKTVVEVDVGVGVKNLVKSKEMVKGKNQNSAKSSVSEELTSDEVDNVDKKVERQSVARDSEIARDYRDRGDLSLAEELKVVVRSFEGILSDLSRADESVVRDNQSKINDVYEKALDLADVLGVKDKVMVADKDFVESKVSLDNLGEVVRNFEGVVANVQSGDVVLQGGKEEVYEKALEFSKMLLVVYDELNVVQGKDVVDEGRLRLEQNVAMLELEVEKRRAQSDLGDQNSEGLRADIVSAKKDVEELQQERSFDQKLPEQQLNNEKEINKATEILSESNIGQKIEDLISKIQLGDPITEDLQREVRKVYDSAVDLSKALSVEVFSDTVSTKEEVSLNAAVRNFEEVLGKVQLGEPMTKELQSEIYEVAKKFDGVVAEIQSFESVKTLVESSGVLVGQENSQSLVTSLQSSVDDSRQASTVVEMANQKVEPAFQADDTFVAAKTQYPEGDVAKVNNTESETVITKDSSQDQRSSLPRGAEELKQVYTDTIDNVVNVNSNIDKINGKIEEAISAVDSKSVTESSANNMAEAKVVLDKVTEAKVAMEEHLKQSDSGIFNGLFGLQSSNLFEASKILPESSNVLLGIAESKDIAKIDAAKTVLSMSMKQKGLEGKMLNLKIKMAEYELKQAESEANPNHRLITDKKREIDDLKKDYETSEREEKKLEEQIKDLK